VGSSVAGSSSRESYDVGVAVLPLRDGVRGRDNDRQAAEPEAGGIPGFDDTIGRRQFRIPDQVAPVILRGEAAVQAATEAIASQIGVAAQRLAESIAIEIAKSPAPSTLRLESVAVSFGVTLTSGIQAMFTAQAGSSAQVTITLSRQPSGSDSAGIS
jgi:hypothetical protein